MAMARDGRSEARDLIGAGAGEVAWARTSAAAENRRPEVARRKRMRAPARRGLRVTDAGSAKRLIAGDGHFEGSRYSAASAKKAPA